MHGGAAPAVKQKAKERLAVLVDPSIETLAHALRQRKKNLPVAVAAAKDVLTPKQRRFVSEYLKDLNGTQAATRAGYSARTANEQAARLLAKVSVRRLVAQRTKRVLAQAELTAADVIRGISRVADSDLRRAFDARGALLPIRQMPDDIAVALASVEVVQRGRGRATEHVHKIKTWDKVRALELLAKYYRLLSDQVEHTGAEGGPIQIVHKYASLDDDAHGTDPKP